jgi:hypothetical protein
MNLRRAWFGGQGSWVPWKNYCSIVSMAASKKAYGGDLGLRRGIPSVRGEVFNKNVEKFVEKSRPTIVTAHRENT